MIELEVGRRQTGKTTRMLEWMRQQPEKTGRVIVCHTHNEAMRLLRDNPDLESWQFVTMSEVRTGSKAFPGLLYGRKWQIELGVDNLDLQVQNLYQFPIGRVTWNERDS